MSGAIAYYHGPERRTLEDNPALSVAGIELQQTCPFFHLGLWFAVHFLFTLALLPFNGPVHKYQESSLFFAKILICLDGLAVLLVAFRFILSLAAKIVSLESTITTLTASLRSISVVVATQRRYPHGGAATVHVPEVQTLDAEGIELSEVPRKMVAYADPNYLSELDLEKAGYGPTNSTVAEEVGEGVQVESEKSDQLHLGRPPWVEDGTLCVVCHNPFGPEGGHMLGTCGHVFHPPCLVDYSKVKRHCFCDVPIHAKYYISTCLLESMPPEQRDLQGRSMLHGNSSWDIIVER